MAMVSPAVADCTLEGGLKSNFAGIRWASGGAAEVVEFLVEPHPNNMTTEIANTNTFFIQIVFD